MKKKGDFIRAWLIVWAIVLAAISATYFRWVTAPALSDEPGIYQNVRVIKAGTSVVIDTREPASCEFEEPLKHITLIMHWYDTHEELNADYILLAEPVEEEEIWGWSNCVWQPEDNWAACDIYVRKPDKVRADMDIDTLGHEVYHGACGDFHD